MNILAYLPRAIGEPAAPTVDPSDRFVPLLVALERKALDTSAISTRDPIEVTAAVMQGHMPKGAGFTEDRSGKLGAIDLVAAEIEGGVIRLLPQLKRAVSREGNVIADGLYAYQSESGLVRFLGLSVQRYRGDWVQTPFPRVTGEAPQIHETVLLDRLLIGDHEVADFTGDGSVIVTPCDRYF